MILGGLADQTAAIDCWQSRVGGSSVFDPRAGYVNEGNPGTVANQPGVGHECRRPFPIGAGISLGRGEYWYKSGIQNLFVAENFFLLCS
jgi:hypothetical protein